MKPSGMFKHEIQIYRPVQTQDSGGSPVSVYEVEITVKCNIQEYNSEEAVKAGREFSNEMKKVYCSSAEDILMSDRAFFNGFFYDIIENSIWLNTYRRLILSRTD